MEICADKKDYATNAQKTLWLTDFPKVCGENILEYQNIFLVFSKNISIIWVQVGFCPYDLKLILFLQFLHHFYLLDGVLLFLTAISHPRKFGFAAAW